MDLPFDAEQGRIICSAALRGPQANGALRFALDTGATGTVVNVAILVALGYDPAISPHRVQVTTGSGIEFARRIVLDKIVALGHEEFCRTAFIFVHWKK